MSHPDPEFEKIFSALTQNGVEFVVIGALAGVFHGHVRVTYDIDICYSRTPENLESLSRVLLSLGAKLRVGDREQEIVLPFKPDVRALKNGLNFTFRTDLGDLDTLGEVSGVGLFESCLSESVPGKVAGIDVRVLSLDKLINAKRAAGRPKDIDDLRALEKIREVFLAGRKKKELG